MGWAVCLVRYVLEVRLGHGRSRVVAPVVVHPHLLQNPLVDHHSRFVVFLQRLHGFFRRLLHMHACTITQLQLVSWYIGLYSKRDLLGWKCI